jgi:type IV pilus assembly protein PilQ
VIQKLFCILIIIMSILSLTAQTAEEGLVTINEDTVLNEAVRILELSSLKFESKKMINQSNFNGNIGIPVNRLPWRQALELIALKNGLVVIDQAGYIALANLPAASASIDGVKMLQPGVDVESKQVRINAIALLADRAYLKSLGIDWSTLLDGTVTLNADFTGASQVPSSIFGLGIGGEFSVGGVQVEINTLLNAIESNQKGTVIAKPNIMVSSGKKGYIQVGQDISVKTIDEAGNTTDKFFATGVIMNVEPTIVEVDGTEVVHMKVSIERSSGTPGNISTIINKSKSETELVLYDGEEAVIGGLYDTDTVKTRGGIPILKDLPWWVLGIRYLTGYYKYETKERELVIILKTDIVENAVERALKAAQNPPKSPVPEEAGTWGYKGE